MTINLKIPDIREMKPRITVFGVGLFSYFLQVPMPIFTWRGGL